MCRVEAKMAIHKLVRETVVGVLYGIFMWGTRITSPFISRKSRRSSSTLLHAHGGDDDDEKKPHYGLSSITVDPPQVDYARNEDDEKKTNGTLKSCMAEATRKSSASTTPLPSELSSLWTTSITGDFLGTESGVHMVNAESGPSVAPWGNPNPSARRRLKQKVKMWDIPPPLTWLQGQREYYTTVPRPYYLNREYTNGRLVLKEATVENFERLQPTGRPSRYPLSTYTSGGGKR